MFSAGITRTIGLRPCTEYDMLSCFDRIPTRTWQTAGQTQFLYQYRASAMLYWRAIKTHQFLAYPNTKFWVHYPLSRTRGQGSKIAYYFLKDTYIHTLTYSILAYACPRAMPGALLSPPPGALCPRPPEPCQGLCWTPPGHPEPCQELCWTPPGHSVPDPLT